MPWSRRLRLTANVLAWPLLAAASLDCGSSNAATSPDGGGAGNAGMGGARGVGDSGGAGQAGAAGTVPASALVESWLHAECAWQSRCRQFPSAEICERVFLTIDEGRELVTLQHDITTGRVRYDDAAAASCMAAIAALPCSEGFELTPKKEPSCAQMFKGTLADGARCFVDEECASRVCLSDFCGGCCAGVCAPSPAGGEGAVCIDRRRDCRDGLYCDTVSPSPTCKKQLPAGAACIRTETDCLDGLSCIGPRGAETCAAPPADGEPCDPDERVCANFDYYCDETEWRCLKSRPAGSPCGSTDYWSSQCEDAAECIDGICRSQLGPGEPCDSFQSAWHLCLGGYCEGGVCSVLFTPIESCWKE